jgi:hypothetical protein
MGSLRARAKRRDPSVAYSVYIFHRAAHQNDNHITWEKRHTTSSMRVAYRKAEKLFNSNEYERVEIKKIFFDHKAARKIDKTLKIYKDGSDRPVGMSGDSWLYVLAALTMAVLTWLGLKTGNSI